jgi:uncharacterized protein (TIGR03067 family)
VAAGQHLFGYIRSRSPYYGATQFWRQAKNMKQLLIALVVFAWFVNPGLSRPVAVTQDDIFATEMRSLAGTWTPVYAENNGYEASDAQLKGIRWMRSADGKWIMQRDNEVVVAWKVAKIDATGSPKTLDIEVTDGPYKGTVYLGIYDLHGGTSRICFALPDRPVRPTEFSAHKGSIRACSTFKREDR